MLYCIQVSQLKCNSFLLHTHNKFQGAFSLRGQGPGLQKRIPYSAPMVLKFTNRQNFIAETLANHIIELCSGWEGWRAQDIELKKYLLQFQ